MQIVAADGVGAAEDPVLVGAGDIASCDGSGDERTAELLDGIEGTVFTTGDNVYGSGTAEEFRDCYDPSWGRHKARTRPAPGNHDYGTSGAGPYYDYFGANAGPAGRGYYSYDLGTWHVISLNSNVASGAGSAQASWLRSDLADNPGPCTATYWHAPVFSSGAHGNNAKMADIWKILDEAGADVVIAGHDHNYERFAPQTFDGKADPNGIRQFVVGTGGKELRPFSDIQANSEVRDSNTAGVLEMTLRQTGYEWRFVPEAGKTFADSGIATCDGPSDTAPSIKRLRPAPRSATDDRTPAIRAKVSDDRTDLQQQDIRLLVDADRVDAFDYDPTRDRLKFTPPSKLSLGRHVVRITARDEAGLSTSRKWRFEVVR